MISISVFSIFMCQCIYLMSLLLICLKLWKKWIYFVFLNICRGLPIFADFFRQCCREDVFWTLADFLPMPMFSTMLHTSKVGVVGLAFRPIEVIRIYVSMYKHARHHGRVIWTYLSPPRFFQLFKIFNFFSVFYQNLIFPKLGLFFNSLIGNFGFVIKVGQIISFSHVGAHFQAKRTM